MIRNSDTGILGTAVRTIHRRAAKNAKMQPVEVSRKERELQRHRWEILRVALKMFSESGFHGVTMNDIAKEAEFSVGTLYKFFANKEDLYGALLLEKINEMEYALRDTLEGGKDEMDSIRTFLDGLIRLVKKNADFFRLYLSEIHRTGPSALSSIGMELRQGREREIARLAAVFERGIKDKVFRDLDPFLLAAALDGMISGLIIQYLEQGDRYSLDADTIMEIFFGSIVLDQSEGRDTTLGNPNKSSSCE
jgi:TetR/AcrR family transcriptional regulator